MGLDFWKKIILFMFPKSEIFSGIIERVFTQHIYSLASAPKAVHDWVTTIFLDLLPAYTTKALEWSKQFGHATEQSETQLLADWKQAGGQSPNYLQQSLHDAGYTQLFVHEWWRQAGDEFELQCGDGKQCGDDYQCGDDFPLPDFPTIRDPQPYINDYQPNNMLVNPMQYSAVIVPQCGDESQCGDDKQCGEIYGSAIFDKIYSHPVDWDEYPFYFYICGETWPTPGEIGLDDIANVQRIIYKIKPMQQRCVLIVNISGWTGYGYFPYGLSAYGL